MLDKHSVKQHVEQLEDCFLELTECTYEILVKKMIDVHRLRARLVSLDVSRRHEHQAFIDKHLMNVDQKMTLTDLWARLGNYWDFLNFDLLEHVVNRFGSEDLKKEMKSYKCDLQSFRKATRLCDFISCWPVRGETPPETELREFVVKVGHQWDNCTLEDLETLKGVITRKFFLPEFVLRLREIKKGCITIMWLIPEQFVMVLQVDIESTSSEFFLEQKIETITIDGQECHPSSRTRHMKEPSSVPVVNVIPPIPAETLYPVTSTFGSRGRSSSIYSSYASSRYAATSSSSGYSSSGYSSGSSSGYSTGSSSGHSSGYETLADWLGHKRASSSTWVNPPTPAEKYMYVREKSVQLIRVLPSYADEMSYVKLLPSPEQYLNKEEIEADPSLPTKYKDYLSSTPAIRATLYTTFNARIAAEVFTWSQHTESPPPTTMTELFTAFTLKTLVDHLLTHPVYHKQLLKVTTFSDLPTDVYRQFQDLCRMACNGVANKQPLVFSTVHLPAGFAHFGLMQKVPQRYTESRVASYHFIHLTLQEYLAAIHISQLRPHEQTRLVQDYLDSDWFKMTMRFLAGLTKLEYIRHKIKRRLVKGEDTYFHFLFEAKDISMTTRTLGSDVRSHYSYETVIRPDYSWTPLDYYVIGLAISRFNCSWGVDFLSSCIDDEKFELFCRGCTGLGRTGCRGHISYANLSQNNITSRSIQSFVNIPPHILQDMRVLNLYTNKLDGSACDLLAKVVPLMPRLEELWLGDNPIGSGGAEQVIKALCGGRVKRLSLYGTWIGKPDCEALCELLKSCTSLQKLYILKDNLSSESVASIITGLSCNSSLTHLDISNSHFSKWDVVSLASALKDQSKCVLTWLALRDCHISGQGASQLAAALYKNSTLKFLDLENNPIGVEGASAMSDMLQHNTSLEELELCDDSVGEEGVHQLINSLKHNKTLVSLYLPKKYKPETSDNRIYWL